MFRLAVRQSARSVNARWNSSIANVAFEDKPFYEAPMAQSVKIMKAVSVTSCAISVFGLPGLLVAMSPENIDIMGQMAISGTVMFVGVGTTSLFHALFRPYVARMYMDTQDRVPLGERYVRLETLNLFGRIKSHQYQVQDIQPLSSSMHPMVSSVAKGTSFYVHPECFEQKMAKKVLVRMVGQTAVDEHQQKLDSIQKG